MDGVYSNGLGFPAEAATLKFPADFLQTPRRLIFLTARHGRDRDVKPANIMKLVQASENVRTTQGGRKPSPESTATQSYRSQPTEMPKPSPFEWMGERLARLLGAKRGRAEADQGGPRLTGSLEFVGVQNGVSNTRTWTSMPSTVTSTLSDYLDSSCKVIDLGTAVAVHDDVDEGLNDIIKTATEIAFAG